MRTLCSLLTAICSLDRAAPARWPRRHVGADRSERTGGCANVVVTHGPVTATLADADSDGHRVGDVRVFHIPLRGWSPTCRRQRRCDPHDHRDRHAGGRRRGPPRPARVHLRRRTGPGRGCRARAVYPAAGPTIPADSSTVRPVVGGSGRYLGAGGVANSTAPRRTARGATHCGCCCRGPPGQGASATGRPAAIDRTRRAVTGRSRAHRPGDHAAGGSSRGARPLARDRARWRVPARALAPRRPGGAHRDAARSPIPC